MACGEESVCVWESANAMIEIKLGSVMVVAVGQQQPNHEMRLMSANYKAAFWLTNHPANMLSILAKVASIFSLDTGKVINI